MATHYKVTLTLNRVPVESVVVGSWPEACLEATRMTLAVSAQDVAVNRCAAVEIAKARSEDVRRAA